MLKRLHQFQNTLNKKLVQSPFIVTWFLKFRHLYSNIDDFFKKIQGKKPVLYLLEYHISEHCNMNCKSCFHFSNLVKEVEFGDFEQYIRDLRQLSTLFSNIKNIHLMGGEPLLNPELPQFIYATRRLLPKATIHILTNGMLIPKISGDLLEAIQTCDVRFRVSIYKPMIEKRMQIIEFLAKHHIKHWVSDPYLHFAKYINPEGNGDAKKAVSGCPASRCTFLNNGQIARCALPFNIKNFNQHFEKSIDMTKDHIDIHDEHLNGFQIKQRLLKPMNACRYCRQVEWVSWEQSKKRDRSDITLDDFCSNG